MDKLNEFLQLLIDTLKGSKEFIISQAPDIVQEIVIRGKFHSVIGAVCFILGLFLIPKLFKRMIGSIDAEAESDVVKYAICLTLVVVMSFVGLMEVCMNWGVWITPKLYVLETIASMIRNKS